jgi:hypothetical protein
LSSSEYLQETSRVSKAVRLLEERRVYELTIYVSNPTHSLLRFLLVSNALDLFLDIALEFWFAVAGELSNHFYKPSSWVYSGFIPPYALKRILSALSEAEASPSAAYYWALITFLAHLSFAQVDVFQRWHTRRCYERTRGQLFCSLHYKSLVRQDVSGKFSHDENGTDTADLGKIVNLMQYATRLVLSLT